MKRCTIGGAATLAGSTIESADATRSLLIGDGTLAGPALKLPPVLSDSRRGNAGRKGTMRKTFRLVTRSDFDGLVCAALLKEMGVLDDTKFVHPKYAQDGQV